MPSSAIVPAFVDPCKVPASAVDKIGSWLAPSAAVVTPGPVLVAGTDGLEDKALASIDVGGPTGPAT